MFRRLWSGLPKDVSYPADLEKLGYFVNDEDEVRSIANPESYFKAFPNKNERVNHRQRFAFDYALEKIINDRLEKEGLQKVPLPLGTPCDEKHVPVFITKDLDKKEKHRIVIFFGEAAKPLGMLAGRVVNGPGGMNKGSLVSVVRYLHEQVLTDGEPHEKEPPGIILANVGQMYWYPDEKRAMTLGASGRVARRTLVDSGRQFVAEINEIKGHESPEKHIASLFEELLPAVVNESTKIDVIAVGDTCEKLQMYLDRKDVWDRWGEKMSSLSLMSTICPVSQLQNDEFKDFLAKRARNYILGEAPLSLPVAPPTGNDSIFIPPLGVPSYSSVEPDHVECILITAMKPILDYLMHNALNPEAENEHFDAVNYKGSQAVEKQPDLQGVADADADADAGVEAIDEETWNKVTDEEKPSLSVLDPGVVDEQRRILAGWDSYEKTGVSIANAALEEDAKKDEADASSN